METEAIRPIGVGIDGLAMLALTSTSATVLPLEAPPEQIGSDLQSPQVNRPRSKTISVKRLSKRELERGRQLYPDEDFSRPSFRAECIQGEHSQRPCPFVSCKHHLYLDINERTGSIKLNFPELEVWDLPESCALDVADRGGVTLEDVGVIMNLTRERIRQLETRGLARLKALNEIATLQDFVE